MTVLLMKIKIGWDFKSVLMDGNAKELEHALEVKLRMMASALVIVSAQSSDLWISMMKTEMLFGTKVDIN